VLSGDIELGMFAAGQPVHHLPDADTQLEWQPLIEGGEVLVSFRLVHASLLLSPARSGDLPAAVVTAARRLIAAASSSPAPHSIAERLRLTIDATVDLPLARLRRSLPTHAPAEWLFPPGRPAPLATALAHLADALGDVGDRHQRHWLASLDEAPPAGLLAVQHLIRLTRELASVLGRAHGRPAPGTSAAVRAALRPTLPLHPSVVQHLSSLLADIDHVERWPSVVAGVDEVREALQRSLLHDPAANDPAANDPAAHTV
jgi:hypothetical protein